LPNERQNLMALANVASDGCGSVRKSHSAPRLFERAQLSRTHDNLCAFDSERAREGLAYAHRSASDDYHSIAAMHDVNYSRSAID
jgi:hypothetical protein